MPAIAMGCLQLSPGTKRILKDAQRGAQRVELLCNPAGIMPLGNNRFTSSTVQGPEQQQSSSSSTLVLHRHSHNMLPGAAGAASVCCTEVQHASSTAGTSAKSLSNGTAGGLQTQQQTLIHCGPGAQDASCTFKPVITKMAAAMKGRPVADMSEGDRLRREAKLVRFWQPALTALTHYCIPPTLTIDWLLTYRSICACWLILGAWMASHSPQTCHLPGCVLVH